jgi:hypothetical protein
MIRKSSKTAKTILDDLPRWYAAEWMRMRDARMIEARLVCGEPLTRAALVRVARRANHEFIRNMREVQS